MPEPIYLDYAAATPIDTAVLQAMLPYMSDNFYNPSARYLAAKQVAQNIVKARKDVAQCLGARPGEIVFTAGGTEANNLAINGVLTAFPGSTVVVSAIEHESVLEPARQYHCKEVSVSQKGVIDVTNLKKRIDDTTVLISVMYANNEIGTIQPLREIAKLIDAVRKERQKQKNPLPLYLHTDACQAANYLDLHVSSLGVDLMTLNGGKIYGPKQSGILFIKTGVKIEPQILGGGQERHYRSGTENVPGIIGFSKALILAQQYRKEESARLQVLQKEFIDEIEKAIPKAQINGSKKHRLPNNVNISIPGVDNERLMMELDELGILCATGSACSASSEEPSHVLAAIGLDEPTIRSSLRLTFGRATTKQALARVVAALKR